MFDLSKFKRTSKRVTFCEKVEQAADLGAEIINRGAWLMGKINNVQFQDGKLIDGDKNYAIIGKVDPDNGKSKGSFLQDIFSVLASLQAVSEYKEEIKTAVKTLEPDYDGPGYQVLDKVSDKLHIIATQDRSDNWDVSALLRYQYKGSPKISLTDIDDISGLWDQISSQLDNAVIDHIKGLNKA